MLTVLALACFLILLAVGCRTLHLYHAVDSPQLLIGGREPVVLTRPQSDGGMVPEFISATLLPGRGMNLLLLTAYLPGTGMVPVFASPEPEAIPALLVNPEDDRAGAATASFGGSFVLPVDGRVAGTLSADGQTISIPWHGRTLTLPADTAGKPVSTNGLFNTQAPVSLEVDALPDGEMSTAVFEPGDFNGQWPSTTRITVVTTLNRKTVDIQVTALNTGTQPEPMNIGWRPFFAIPSGQRGQLQLRLPAADPLDATVSGDPDFTARGGAALGSRNLDATYTHLRAGLMQDDPAAEMVDRLGNYGLRLTILSPVIKVLHVAAPAGKPVITISPRMGADNPFSRQTEGVTTLAPGDSIEWKIRMEIFHPSHANDASMLP